MGMTDAFDGGKADLSGILSGKAFCGGVYQASRVEINRRSTGSSGDSLFKDRGTEVLPDFDLLLVDRPFIFAITDTETLAPIYLGVIANMN